jgi:hypothetical protein
VRLSGRAHIAVLPVRVTHRRPWRRRLYLAAAAASRLPHEVRRPRSVTSGMPPRDPNVDRVTTIVAEMSFAMILSQRLRLMGSCLTLMYSMVDAMAFLSMPDKGLKGRAKEDVERDDFTSWVDRYVLSRIATACSALDLYAARCGWVHTHGFDSKLARQGKAKIVLYAWGAETVDVLNQLPSAKGKSIRASVAVDLDELVVAVTRGAAAFLADVAADAPQRQRIASRIRWWQKHVNQRAGGYVKSDSLLGEVTPERASNDCKAALMSVREVFTLAAPDPAGNRPPL